MATARVYCAQTQYRIKSLTERDDETGNPLYWSNDHGWGDRASATMFTLEECLSARLIGRWEFEKE